MNMANLTYFSESHRKYSEACQREVEEMMKHPLTAEQAMEQARRNKRASQEARKQREERVVKIVPEHSFPEESEYICRRICMCNQYQRTCTLQPYKCRKALKKVEELKRRLVLGNDASARMTFEEMRVAKDYYFIV